MNKLTDSEIVKALERCGQHRECCYCNSVEECGSKRVLTESCLDLINRQKAEIERLQDRNNKCIYLSDDETTEFCVDGACPKFKTEEMIKTEAIKEFIEKFKAYIPSIDGDTTMDCVERAIKQAKKEMVGE